MITAKITNITLDVDRIRVFITLSNTKEENNTFLPDATANDILVWKQEREQYYNELEQKVEDLKQELIEE